MSGVVTNPITTYHHYTPGHYAGGCAFYQMAATPFLCPKSMGGGLTERSYFNRMILAGVHSAKRP